MKTFCQFCFNDPVTHLQQKELCGVCERETEVAKKKPVIPSCNNCAKESYCPMRTGEMSCTGFQKKPETRADQIRAMTDEELANWLGVYCNGQTAQEVGKPCVSGMGSCEECWLDWLRQEASE